MELESGGFRGIGMELSIEVGLEGLRGRGRVG